MDTLLKEAIAEAKLIKETAYANAKAALEEAFTPQIKELLSKKLRAEAEGEEVEPEADEPIVHDLESPEEGTEGTEDNEDLDEIFNKLREDLDGSEEPVEDESEFVADEEPAPEVAPEEPAPEASEVPADDEITFDDEEPFDDEDEINLDFDDEEPAPEVAPEAPAPEAEPAPEVAPEAPAPEAEPTPEEESFPEGDLEQEEGFDSMEFDDEPLQNEGDSASNYDEEFEDDDSIGGIEPFGKGNRSEEGPEDSDVPSHQDRQHPEFDADDEEDLDIEEVLREYEMESEEDGEEPMESDEELTNQLQQTEAELREHRKVIKYLRSKLNEVNLLNSKLLYTNKLFKDNSLNMNQKVQVVEAFDAASSVKEAKSVYKTLAEVFAGIKAKKAEKAERIVEGLASKPIASTKPSEEIISEGNKVASRFQVLAGIRKRTI